MVSPLGDRPEQPGSEAERSGNSGKSKPDWTTQVDAELAFRLVDSILPFEACLYHQILPLSLEGSRLKLGMVNPDDSAALDYVRRILAYMNCSLVPHPIASDVHYAALSAYLSYSDSQKKSVSSSSQPVARRIAKKLAEHSAKRSAENRAASDQDPGLNPTLVVDSPTQLPPLPIEADDNMTMVERSQFTIATPSQTDATVAHFLTDEPIDSPTILDIHPQHLSDPTDVLATLSPAALLDELLGRVLVWGIGRLYLERKETYGRILWSQNGELKEILDELPIETFEGVVLELKHLTHVGSAPVQKPKQVEIERTYQDERLLLRLRLMPGRNGEEATLQVLRGAALRFYQQQQLVNLGQEALGIAQQLQQKMNDVYAHSRTRSVNLPEHLGIYPELDLILKRIGYQLSELQSFRMDDLADE